VIIILKPDLAPDGAEVAAILGLAAQFPNIMAKVYAHQGAAHALTEVHLIGETKAVPAEIFAEQPYVVRVVRVSEKYRLLGRHEGQIDAIGFEYQGVRFGQDTLHVFPGLCAVDTRDNVDRTMRAIAAAGLTTCRMGAYKPRTSPYEFQGHGKACLPYVFELAGKHQIRVIAMEILRDQHLDEIREALRAAGDPTGVMLQIGTRTPRTSSS